MAYNNNKSNRDQRKYENKPKFDNRSCNRGNYRGGFTQRNPGQKDNNGTNMHDYNKPDSNEWQDSRQEHNYNVDRKPMVFDNATFDPHSMDGDSNIPSYLQKALQPGTNAPKALEVRELTN